MPIVHVAPGHRAGWLVLAAVTAAGALAWQAARRGPAAPPPPVSCGVRPLDNPVVVPSPRFAVPPPGDPYPRAEPMLIPNAFEGQPEPNIAPVSRTRVNHCIARSHCR
jgi:hypothetical protein